MTDENLTPEDLAHVTADVAWVMICDDCLGAIPRGAINIDAYGRAVADIPPEVLLLTARQLARDPDVTMLPSPGQFRLRVLELIGGRVPDWSAAYRQACEYATWRFPRGAGQPAGERPHLDPLTQEVMDELGARLFRDPTDNLKPQFRQVWQDKARRVIADLCSPARLAPAADRALRSGALTELGVGAPDQRGEKAMRRLMPPDRGQGR